MTVCGIGMTGTVPLMLAVRGTRASSPAGKPTAMLTELREGWAEFRSHTWLWVIVVQFCLIMMAWYAAFQVLGPVVARQHLGGPAAWGAITASDSCGLIAAVSALALIPGDIRTIRGAQPGHAEPDAEGRQATVAIR
ncbi:MAG TPA: hypothetical protein VF482_16400 [Trebonia sp.]